MEVKAVDLSDVLGITVRELLLKNGIDPLTADFADIAKALQSSEPVTRSESYDVIDRHLRNTLDDESYASFSSHLDTVYTPTVSLEEHNKRIAELEADIDTYVPIANQQATEIMQLQATNKKLLDALKELVAENKRNRINAPSKTLFEITADMKAQQVIAEAEEKVG